MSKEEKIGTLDLVKVDKARITKVIEIYYHWKDLNTEIQTFSGSRGINFPSELSEYMVAYVLGIHINKNGSGDAIDISDPNHPIVYEIKGSSANELSAPSSFSPSEEFDELIFARLEKKDDILKIYKTGINSTALGDIKVNATQTVKDQQKGKRRPRLSIYNTIIKPLGLEPDYLFDIRNKKIITK